MKDDDKPILDEGIPIPGRYSDREVPDKYHFGLLTKVEEQRIFIPLGNRSEINLRQNINQHKRRWEEKTGNVYSVHKAERKGKQGFGIWLVKKGKAS